MLLALLACLATPTDTDLDCDDGFEARDGACYEVDNGGGDTADSAVDTSTDTGSGDTADTSDDSGDTAAPVDLDGDGYGTPADCDDTSTAIHPGADELCDGVDSDCDGETDEGVTSTWFADVDTDGHGDPAATLAACESPVGYVDVGDDCDDAAPDTYPGAADDTNDGLDQDCDGTADEDWDPCATRLGRLDFPADVYDMVGGYTNNVGTITGTGYVCSLTCDKGWVSSAFLSTSQSCASSVALPAWNDPELVICLTVDPGAVEDVTCDFGTSDGTHSITMRRSG